MVPDQVSCCHQDVLKFVPDITYQNEVVIDLHKKLITNKKC
jgi:hypothetical protein